MLKSNRGKIKIEGNISDIMADFGTLAFSILIATAKKDKDKTEYVAGAMVQTLAHAFAQAGEETGIEFDFDKMEEMSNG